MGKNDVKDLNLLPGDIVENKLTLIGDKGNTVARGSRLKVVATDGDEAALVRPVVADLMNTEIFMSSYKYLKVIKTPTNIKVVEPEKINEAGRNRKNRKRKIKKARA